jgi:hypothetical protein
MTNHPIIPPPELVQDWLIDGVGKPSLVNYLAAEAAQWGAAQELEACCDHIRDYQWGFVDRPDGTKMHRAVDLELARRPKSLSLKEQALQALAEAIKMADDTPPEGICSDQANIIRRALEALDD